MSKEIIFHQLFEKESSTYTYLLADIDTREAILIDPVLEMIERDLNFLKELNLHLKLVLDTHVHADHVTASGELRKRTGAKIGLGAFYELTCPDLFIDDGDVLEVGGISIKAIHTPGHTVGCLTYLINDMIFTGDALLIRGCGRTDFQGGSSEKLYHSVREKLFNLPEGTVVYPGHDYKGFSRSSIAEEMHFNPRLNLKNSKEVFVEIMGNLKLAHPKKILEAVPANQQCGILARN